MRKILKRLVAVIAILAVLFGVFSPRVFAANGEYTKPECEGIFQDLTCTTLDHAASFMTQAYESLADWFLEIDPAAFDYTYVGSPGYALHTAWGTMRTLANIAFAILLIIVSLSQITGIGISNYGIKKMMPRLVTGVLMVNLSYFICQGAIDLANIVGSGLSSLFEDLMIDSMPPDVGFSVGNTALMSIMVAVVSYLVIMVKGLGTKVIMLAILGILAIVLAIIVLFVVAVVRQALCILLVVFAPIAFVCYMLPGTKAIFNKWFSMLKGVLLAYPICSLMIYGGSYAGAVIYGTWMDNGDYGEVLRNLSFLIIATVPYFFIPSVIMKSLSEAEGAVARFSKFLQRNGRGAAMRTRAMTDLNRRADQGQQLARAGYRRNLKGDIVKKWRPKQLAENSSDGVMRRSGKRLFNSVLRYQDKLNAPYVRNVTRINAEERRASVNKQKLARMNAKDRSNFYVFDPTANGGAGGYVKVGAPLTNRQIRKGMYKGQKVYRATKSNPNTTSGSSDFVRSSAGDASRVRASLKANEAKVNAERFADLTGQEKNLEVSAWREQIKNDNMNATQISEAIKKITTDKEKLVNRTQLEAYTSALVADGMAGRDALEALLGDNNVQKNVDAIKTMANGLTKAELNSIKKKNPILYNKIMAIRNDKNGTFNVGDLSIDKNFAVTLDQLDGLSPKHLSEMDASAQKRVVEDLLNSVAADAKSLNDARTVKAIALAEGALGNAEIRATMSPEQIANLEQIVNLRKTAVEAASAKTMRSDRQALSDTATVGGRNYSDTSTMTLEDVSTNFRDDFKKTFLDESKQPGGNEGILGAITQGYDTTRMESIVRAANAQLDEILRGRGMHGAELTAAREDIMRGVMEDVDRKVKAKTKKMVDRYKQGLEASGVDADTVKQRTGEFKTKLRGPETVCDMLTQRINLRG